MGCWGYGILESDDALDWESDFFDTAGLDTLDDAIDAPKTRAALEAALPALLKRAADYPYDGEDQRERMRKAMGYQVLASLLMAAGCAFSEDVRSELAQRLLDCSEYKMGICTPDEVRSRLAEVGADEDEILKALKAHAGERVRGRVKAIEELLVQLASYDVAGGSPLQVPSRGLLETIAGAMA